MDVFSSKQISQITILTKMTNNIQPHFLHWNVLVSYWFGLGHAGAAAQPVTFPETLNLNDQEYYKSKWMQDQNEYRDSLDWMHNNNKNPYSIVLC